MHPTNLKEVMRRWVSGVAILTTGNESVRHGMTVNSFTSVSIDPPCVTVTLAHSSRTKKLLDQTDYFGIHLLAEDQQDLSDRFADRMPDNEDRFSNLKTVEGTNHIPILQDAAAYLECKVIHRFEMTNSTLYIGEVLTSEKGEDKPPLAYFNREYHRIAK